MHLSKAGREVPRDQKENQQPAPIDVDVDAEEPANSKSASHSPILSVLLPLRDDSRECVRAARQLSRKAELVVVPGGDADQRAIEHLDQRQVDERAVLLADDPVGGPLVFE